MTNPLDGRVVRCEDTVSSDVMCFVCAMSGECAMSGVCAMSGEWFDVCDVMSE